ncbi:MAG TPA: PhoH family protein [Kofleriaceae bacterium]|nr:PhoH family protein [Kofleriaceae bacterium]
MAVKNYVLDTNVLLHDARAIYAFADNNVVIPIYVLEEVDTFKKDQSELGRNARQIARELDQFRSVGGLSHPQKLENGGTVRVALSKNPPKNPSNDSRSMDQRIIEIALEVRDGDPKVPTILVTKDVNMRVRGDALGLETVDFEPERISIDELYPGNRDILVPSGTIDKFYAEGSVVVDAPGLHANEYLTLKDDSGKSALTRWDKATEKAVPVKKLREGVWGIKPRNKEQHFALDLLLNDDVKLVTLVGKAGTGKTLLAIAAGLQKVTEDQVFSKLLVSRPIFPLGRDIGYLPGTIEEKLNPWMQPIYDNLELLLGLNKSDKKEGRSYAELVDLGFVEIEPLTYIRGRSLPNVYMIVDEAQNLTPHEIKTIVTRAGEGTKIILTGDPYQIDHPYLDSSNNGLTTVAERFKQEGIAGHVILTKGERSPLAELATHIL